MKRAAAVVVFLSVCAAVLASADASTARRAILDPTPLRPVGGPIVGVRSDGERFAVLRYEQPPGEVPRTVYTSTLIDTWTGRRSALPSSEECVNPAISEQTTTVTAGRALLNCLRDGQSVGVVRDLATGQETRLPSPPIVEGQTGGLGYQILGRRWVQADGHCPGSAVMTPRFCYYYVNLMTREVRFVQRDPQTQVGFYDLDDPALPLRTTCRPGDRYDDYSRQYAPPFYISKNGLARCSDGRVVQPMRGYWSGSDLSGGFLSWGYGNSGYDGHVARGTDRVYVYNIARKRLYAWTLPRRDRRKNVKGPVGHPIRTLCTLYVAVTRGFTDDGIVNRIRLYTAPMPPPRDPRCTSR